MRKWAKSAALLFCAAASVYNGPVAYAGEASQLNQSDSSSEVKIISDSPGAADSAPTTQSDSEPLISMIDAKTFDIHTNKNSTIVEVLRDIAFQTHRNIIPSKGVSGTLPAIDLYSVTINEALDAILHTNGMDWKQTGNVIYVYTNKEKQDQEKAALKTTTQTFTLHYIPATDALLLIKPAESTDAIVAATKDATSGIDTGDGGGGDTAGSTGGTSTTGGNSESGADIIVVTDYPQNLEQISKIIQDVDRRPQQILVEATILEATLTENNAMGIDFSLMGGVNFDQLLTNGTPLTSALSGSILNASAGTGTSTPASLIKQGYAGATSGNYDTQVPPGGMQVGIVKNNLGVFISALESVADTTVLANPKVLVLNKQSGEVQVGQQLGYQTTTVSQTTSTQTVEFLNTGTILSFRPFVGADGYIRMEIHPEDSTGSVTNNLPDKTTTEVTSNVMIKDGNTIVIGGMFKDNSQSSRSQVPILGDIPLVGALFRSKTDATSRQEIIILLTPHIIKDDSEYSKASEEELKDAETLRVGVRKGMMWFGRERLAESAYENAVAEMNKPNPDLNAALWHLNCAINLNPKFIEAIQMKEKITGKQVTDVDNSTIRSFVRDQIMLDNAAPTTLPSAATTAAALSPAPVVFKPVASSPAPSSSAPKPSISEIPSTRPSADAAMPDDDDEDAVSTGNP